VSKVSNLKSIHRRFLQSGELVIATSGASGSSTVTGTESVSQIVNWGCQTTIGSTLGTDGSWSMSAGSGTYTGTTTDNWGYGGSGQRHRQDQRPAKMLVF